MTQADFLTWLRLIMPLAPVVCAVLAARGLMHYFQLESYQFPGYFRTLRLNRVHALMPGLAASCVSLLMYYLADVLALRQGPGWVGIGFAVLVLPVSALAGLGISRALRERKAKKKFVFTNRVKRLYGVLFAVCWLVSALLNRLPWAVLPALWPLLLPLVVALAGLLAWPLEKLISEMYFRDARRRLMSVPGLVRIGITGSYGKTSVKHILGTILSEKYPTLITPASFNTPMGVSRAIRERLLPSHQVFVGEMGARHVGDIRELCRLVRPTIGMITSVGPQHLETFKSIERVAKTKYELINALPTDGHAYFYDDGALVTQMYERTQKPKTLCGKDPQRADVWCANVSVSSQGSAFTLNIKGKGSVECQTRLLGEHNIQNILLACAVASDLGLSLKQIAHAISRLEPVRCRLELIHHPGSFTIINDAFNANPIGARAALEVLRAFPKRRIVITPGMVELGQKEAEYNRDFGRQIADCADIAIIVGKNRAQPILQGLKEAGFPDENAYRVDSLDASTQLLATLVTPEDTVLYENDLPEQYQEA
ncbi:MAG TPA: UDP-N-acetylmuramoyl-tripeptide--D-alanyl-D-alanine ligase [Candidatus Limiplasma stercoravium]|nr:UDP-N-acetylmuramoyl-tripeptide--D-alanyl-D-alanine ligase [Candidatus Limiplasma stercoravium]